MLNAKRNILKYSFRLVYWGCACNVPICPLFGTDINQRYGELDNWSTPIYHTKQKYTDLEY